MNRRLKLTFFITMAWVNKAFFSPFIERIVAGDQICNVPVIDKNRRTRTSRHLRAHSYRRFLCFVKCFFNLGFRIQAARLFFHYIDGATKIIASAGTG
ncbi:MAG: hypothetical protein R2861_10865 [Desulfobacterales bacterium]